MPATKAVTKRYYPALSEVITVDDLPEFLHFAEDGLNALLDKIHYKNLQYSKSYRGDGAFYSLDIISKNIGLDLPFGLRLVLNPDEDGDSTISSFPISLEYQWEVLAFLRSFNLQNFSFTPDAFFQLGLQIFRISEEQVIAQTLNYFIEDDDTSNGKFQQLIDAINSFYPDADLELPEDEDPTVEMVAAMIQQNPAIPDSISELMFTIYVLDADLSVTERNLQQFYNLMVPDGIENYIRSLLVPKVKATLTLSAALEFPNNVLRPVTADGVPIPDTKTLFKFAEATFYADTEAGIGTQLELAGSLIPEYSEIGNTGLLIGFTNAKLDLSRKTNIPEADAAGYPVDFMGLYVQHAVIKFLRFGDDDTDKTSASITADNLFIGTGGVSGTIALEADGLLYRKFGNFAVELNAFSITFRQGTIINSDIRGRLTIGRFKQGQDPAVIDIVVHIDDDGNFSITALPQDGLFKITLPEVLELDIRSLSLGKQTRGFYVEVAGQLNFIADLPVLGQVLPKGIEIKKLRIWDNGDMEFEGGGLVVPKSFRLNVGPAKLEVTNISLGAYSRKFNGIERDYRFFGFDGMINTGRAGVNATGNGIKFYFTVDDNGQDKPFNSFISIDGIAIDLTIPGNATKDNAAFTLNGYLSMSNPDPTISGSSAGSEYTGAVSFTMPRLKLAGSAGMRLNPDVPAFVVDIGLELATPIPLGATGLGIYGFRGLIGQHYMPSKSATTPPLPDSASWWDYYKAKSTRTHREGIEIDKFEDKPGYSVGAGISIATSFDSGKIFSSKLFLLLGLPDVFLIQGQAGILRSRIGLNDDVDPPFSAFIAIDSSSFRGNLGVNYRLPEGGGLDGKIFSLSGELDMAFFFNNSSGWYLNVGKDQPESARVQARILTLFQGYAYLMISSRGFKAGAGARFDFKRSFGPVGVGIGAFIDMGGSISFKPVQIGAFIQFGGYAYIKVLFIKLGLSVQVGLAVEAPHPFNIAGSIEIKIKVIFKKIKFRLDVSWYFNNDYGPLLQPIPVLQLPDPAKGYLPAGATNILSNETFPINYVNVEMTGDNISIPAPGDNRWHHNFNNAESVMNVTIPMDSFIDIELLKPVRPGRLKIGGAANQLPDGYTELLPPQKGRGDQVKHEFELMGVDIFIWKETSGAAGSWQPYNVYEAVTAIVEGNTGGNAVSLSSLNEGYWQFTEPNRYNKIRLLSQNMFSFSNQSTNAFAELDGQNFQRKDLFCFENIIKKTVINWKDVNVNTPYPQGVNFSFKGEAFLANGIELTVGAGNNGEGNSLFMDTNGGRLVITLSKAVTHLELKFGENNNDLKIDYIKKIYRTGVFGQSAVRDLYLTPAFLYKGEENRTVVYDDLNQSIDQVVLSFVRANTLDYSGDLIIGGHFSLPSQYPAPPLVAVTRDEEADKSVLFATIYNRSFNTAEVLAAGYRNVPGTIGQWSMSGIYDATGSRPGILSGSPDLTPGFYEKNTSGLEVMSSVYAFSGNADAVFVPAVALNESGSFAFEVTALFNPFLNGISTLLYKVNQDPATGHKKGFALHLYQDTSPMQGTVYSDMDNVPTFTVWLTCYNDDESAGFQVSEKYTLNCATFQVTPKQYKRILISVNRETEKIDIFIDKILKLSADIPEQLQPYVPATSELTCLEELSYLSEVQQRRQEENEIDEGRLIDEVQLLGDGLSKTIQPVWRPDTTFAFTVKTRDIVNGNTNGSVQKTHIFGFKTAGPVGHFQQQSPAYKALEAEDRAAEFKLSGLKYYIDYERSSPDAQSRYDLSKPVFYQSPKIRLLFIKPYINAMFANWSTYQGLPPVNSSLQIELIDPFGQLISPQLVWEQLPDQEITLDNYQSLPPDQQILFWMNIAALQDSCNINPLIIKKRTKQGAYQLPELLPNKLYTAKFNAVYQPSGKAEQKQEVHKFNFKTSLFASFAEQVGSFILNEEAGVPQYALYPINVSFSASQIDTVLKKLVDDVTDNDDADFLNFAVKYDRLVYGGLGLKNLEPIQTTVICPVINTDPTDGSNTKTILGIIIRNPEPFNDPKTPADVLADTLKMSLTTEDQVVILPDQFYYIHSRDTSAVMVTNADLSLPAGDIKLDFRYKIFNGTDYQTEHEDYESPLIAISTNINDLDNL